MTNWTFILPDSVATTLCVLSVLDQSAFDDTALYCIGRESNIKKLFLRGTSIKDAAFRCFKNAFLKLETLILRDCRVMTSTAFAAMAHSMRHIKHLEFTGQHQVERAGFQSLQLMTALERLHLSCSDLPINDQGETDLDFLSTLKLQSLTLTHCIGLTSAGIDRIAATQEATLKYLSITDGHQLHRAHFLPLKMLPHLTNLHLTRGNLISFPPSSAPLHFDCRSVDFRRWCLREGPYGAVQTPVPLSRVAQPVLPAPASATLLNAFNNDPTYRPPLSRHDSARAKQGAQSVPKTNVTHRVSARLNRDAQPVPAPVLLPKLVFSRHDPARLNRNAQPAPAAHALIPVPVPSVPTLIPRHIVWHPNGSERPSRADRSLMWHPDQGPRRDLAAQPSVNPGARGLPNPATAAFAAAYVMAELLGEDLQAAPGETYEDAMDTDKV
jgi:hypothetical protein